MLSFRNASCYGSAFLSFLTPTSPHSPLLTPSRPLTAHTPLTRSSN